MEKPIEATALLKTIGEVLAEPNEARLRRMCGYQQDTRHLRSPNAGAAEKVHSPPITFHERRQPHRVLRWKEE